MDERTEAQVAADREKLGLSEDRFRELRAFLSGATFGRAVPCDHTFSRTEEWAGRMGVDMEGLVEGLKAFGAACDCEVGSRVPPSRFGWSG